MNDSVNTTLWNPQLPVISGKKLSYKWKEYMLVRMTKEWVVKSWTPIDLTNQWLMAINQTTIFIYWIPERFLAYAIINEVECPNVLEDEWLCLQWLKIELDNVPWNILQEYIRWREDFFRNMERYWLEIWKDEKYASEMKRCYEYLESKKRQRETISEILWLLESTSL